MDKKIKQECLEAIIKKANKSTIQSCVNLRTPYELAYVHRYIVEDFFNVKYGTSSFGVVAQDLFRDFKVNHIRMEELRKEIIYHKYRYKHSISLSKKREHLEVHNKLVEEERELYKPIRAFVKFCNKVKSDLNNTNYGKPQKK